MLSRCLQRRMCFGSPSLLRGAVADVGTGPAASAVRQSPPFGVFQDAHIKPFPVRAAFDIGTGGFVSLAIGRVDAQHHAIQTLLHHQRVAVRLEYERRVVPSDRTDGGSDPSSSRRCISAATITDIRTKLRLLTGVLKRMEFRGINEVAGMLTYPLCACDNAAEFCAALEKEFQIRLVVVGHPLTKEGKKVASGDRGVVPTVPPAAWMAHLGFTAAAAASQCVARHRMICIEEAERHGTITLCGWDHRSVLKDNGGGETTQREHAQRLGECDEDAFLRIATNKTSTAVSGQSSGHDENIVHQGPMAFNRHVLPLTTNDVQRLLLVNVQRRHLPTGVLEAQQLLSSPNPVQRREWNEVVSLCARMLSATMPAWVKEKSSSGGVICGASSNGGLLNIVARVSQQVDCSLYHLETQAEHHYCGLTDTLLDAFPEPERVLSSAALGSALMRALETPRIRYLPDVSVAHALLVWTGLWANDNRVAIRKALGKETFFTQRHTTRSFAPPKDKNYRGQPVRV